MARKATTKASGIIELTVEEVLEPAAMGAFRPEVQGDPLTGSSLATFPKPSAQIEIVEHAGLLRLEDRKLYNVLLAASWSAIGKGEGGPFEASAINVRRAIGQQSEHSNRRLRDSLQRLLATTIHFRKKMPDGKIGEAATNLISFFSVAGGFVQWDFHASLRPYLERPSRWARLNLGTANKFQSKYSMVLYEQLSLRKDLDYPIWNVSIEELRQFCGVPVDRYPYFSQLKQSVLQPAIDEVNEHAKFKVEMEVIEEGPGKKPARIRFTVLSDRKALT
jgi:hypothetical protein